jgi:predicted dehydrogenase
VPLTPERGAWQTFYALFEAALVSGDPADLPVDPQDALEVLKVLEAARLSAAEQRVVTLD